MNRRFDRIALSWLPERPADFRARCKALGPADDGGAVATLAATRLDANDLSSLSKAIRRLRSSQAPLNGLQPMKVAIIGNGSHELIGDALIASAARHRILLDLIEVPFDSAEAAVLDPGSPLLTAQPDAIVFNFTYRAFGLSEFDGAADRPAAERRVAVALDRIGGLADAIGRRSRATIILQTVPPPSWRLFGSLDRRIAGSPAALIAALNDGIVAAAASPHVLFDTAALAEAVGLDQWHDATQWHGFKLPFSQRLVPLYADHLARVLAAMRGLTRKCLVLDLDNTLWGGVIGDDGIDGIRLGNGLADGEAFLEVQQMARRLRRRGVVLAVCSKNDDAIARRAFREHPDMILSDADITVFQANWRDKAQNLEAIARELDLGVESLVFLDDNPAERELIRQKLPMVAVPELPDDPSLFAETLAAAGYFETVSFSDEDARRSEMYSARARVAELRDGAGDLDAFLASLDMEITFAPFDAVGRSRIAQLINKSNQFNLTTRRYTDSDVQAFEHDPAVFTLQVRLRDKFADHGMISVVICKPVAPAEWEIDTWLMSCRVLGRGVEQAVLNEIVGQAAARGIQTLTGRFIASGRNALVIDHYRKLGFSRVVESAAESVWRLNVAEFQVLPVAMGVVRA